MKGMSHCAPSPSLGARANHLQNSPSHLRETIQAERDLRLACARFWRGASASWQGPSPTLKLRRGTGEAFNLRRRTKSQSLLLALPSETAPTLPRGSPRRNDSPRTTLSMRRLAGRRPPPPPIVVGTPPARTQLDRVYHGGASVEHRLPSMSALNPVPARSERVADSIIWRDSKTSGVGPPNQDLLPLPPPLLALSPCFPIGPDALLPPQASADCRRSGMPAVPAVDSAESDGSDVSDIDPNDMPGAFNSTAEPIEPDELLKTLLAEWFSDYACSPAGGRGRRLTRKSKPFWELKDEADLAARLLSV